jgi:hypothetical protein
VINEPTLSDDRLQRRRDHLMKEINLMQVEDRRTAEGGVRGQMPGRLGLRAPRRRWGRYSLPGGVLVAGAAAVALVAALGSPGRFGAGQVAAGGLRIERISQQTVAVQIVDTRAAGEAMTRQLHEQGLNITIETVPASPQLVGTWLMTAFSADVPPAVAKEINTQVPGGYAATVEVPATFTGEITLSAGRAPDRGEQPMVIGKVNALAPGGRLGCLHASGGAAQDVELAVEGYGYTVTWADGDDRDTAAVAAPPTDARVVSAFIDDARPTVAQLVVARPGSARYDARAQIGYSPHQWTQRASNPATCTRA